MRVLGIDASLSATGLCLLDIETFNKKTFITETLTNDLKGVERILYIEKKVIEYAKNVDLVVIENYAFDAKYNREVLGELQGVLKRRLYLMNKPILLVDTHKLKKIQTGASRNPTKLKVKDWIMQEVLNRYDIDFKGKDNECDAFGLAVLGLCSLDLSNIQKLNIPAFVKGDLTEVLTKVINKKPKIKKNISYYFSLPYNIICNSSNGEYECSIEYLGITVKASTLKKGLAALEKEKRLKIRSLRKDKKRILINKDISGRISYIIKR